MTSAAARSLLAAWDNGSTLDPAAFPLTDPDAGLALQTEINALRRARGEREARHAFAQPRPGDGACFRVELPVATIAVPNDPAGEQR